MDSFVEERTYRVLKPGAIQLALVHDQSCCAERALPEKVGYRGAILLVNFDLAVGETLRLDFQHAATGLALSRQATVQSSEVQAALEWRVECSFDVPLPEHAMHDLLDAGVLDRRRDARDPFHLPVLVQWEYDSTSCAGFLWNISEGGFCLVCPRKPGRKVTVFTKDPGVRISARTRWQTKSGGGFVIGCEFVNADSYREMLTWKPRPIVARPRGLERRQAVARAFRELVSRMLSTRQTDAREVAELQSALSDEPS